MEVFIFNFVAQFCEYGVGVVLDFMFRVHPFTGAQVTVRFRIDLDEHCQGLEIRVLRDGWLRFGGAGGPFEVQVAGLGCGLHLERRALQLHLFKKRETGLPDIIEVGCRLDPVPALVRQYPECFALLCPLLVLCHLVEQVVEAYAAKNPDADKGGDGECPDHQGGQFVAGEGDNHGGPAQQ